MPASENRQINPSMLVLAREARGLTQSALSERIEISQSHFSKMEAGLWPVTPDLLGRIAKELRFPEQFFFSTETLFGPGVSEFYHRKRESAGALLLRQNYARINLVLIHLQRLLRGADIGECKIPRFDPDDAKTIPEIAQAVRAMWNLPSGPIANLVGTVEAAGGIVIRWPFGTPKIDGISRWAPGLPPVFFINDQIPMDRARLTLAHELGHMVLHDAPSPSMEPEANEFAREFLTPSREIRRHLEGCTIYKLSTLKPYWKVSMQALLYAAEEISAITPRTARHLWTQMSTYRRREPPELDLPEEPPQLLAEIIKLYRGHLSFSLEQLGQLLTVLPEDLIDLYQLAPDVAQRPRISLVK